MILAKAINKAEEIFKPNKMIFEIVNKLEIYKKIIKFL